MIGDRYSAPMHLSLLSPPDVDLSPVSHLFLLALIKGGGCVNVSALSTNDLQEASPHTKSAERKVKAPR